MAMKIDLVTRMLLVEISPLEEQWGARFLSTRLEKRRSRRASSLRLQELTIFKLKNLEDGQELFYPNFTWNKLPKYLHQGILQATSNQALAQVTCFFCSNWEYGIVGYAACLFVSRKMPVIEFELWPEVNSIYCSER
ncbi:hypothetical protein H5410_056389 [Solanum commersonii]|uniref:Uncharacterized protein n=1 Tax=Solanum commersonii TaxID=4109 RepID=A0A9J5WM07_SOLCO|nr:hypothetical protein H5410_056389 [Solanum commersonii]